MPFSLFVDLVMTFLLAGTIYFVWRLSSQIDRFRNTRADMDRLIRDLNFAIERSQQAIQGMRDAAQTSGEDLQRIMRGATELSDELQIMTESANSLAARLEQASARGGTGGDVQKLSTAEPVRRETYTADTSFPGFAIRDPEFDGSSVRDDDVDWAADDDMRSEAEKELIKAMQNKKTTRSIM